MYLKRLEINGFKSFAQHTEMLFEKGVTAIVGPNGSGKSNVSDAVRWVLGEQSARMLRGNRKEDVIFNGTQKRRPMQYCEVTLTFDNHDGLLPLEYAEVSVTRRLYRSGESEYLLNRTNCRLKDIVDLFRDTGIGKEGYSIIGQGRVDDILSPRSENRRQIFEEAAGIVKHRVRKEEARKKLDNTLQNLQRLEDLLEELGAQLIPLEEQSKKAREYIQISQELKELELALFVRQYENNEQRLSAFALDIEALDGQILSANEKSGQTELELQRTREGLSALDTEIAVMQQRRMEISECIAQSEGDERVLAERTESLSRENSRLQAEITTEDQKTSVLRRDIGLIALDADNKEETLKGLFTALEAKEGELRALEERIGEEQARLEEKKTSLMDALNILVDVRSRGARLSQAKAGIEERLAQIKEEREAAGREAAVLEAERGETKDTLSGIKGALQEKQKEIAEAERGAAELRESAARSGQALQAAQRSLHEKETRKTLLEDMARDFEGYSFGVRMILKQASGDAWLKKGVYGVLGDLIQVPAGLETAIEVALGPAVGNVVTATDQDAKELIGFLRSNKYGRATFYPVSTVRPRTLTEKERALLNVPGCLGVASELVACDARFQGVIGSVLGRTAVMETLDQAVLLARSAGHTFKIVTRSGDVMSPGGAMSGGSRKENDTGLFMRKRALLELEREISDLKTRLAEMDKRSSNERREIQAIAELLVSRNEQVHALQVELAQVRERNEIIEENMRETARRIQLIDAENDRISEKMADILQQMEGSETQQGDIEASQLSARDEIAAMQKALDTLIESREKALKTITTERIGLESAKREKSAAADSRKRLQKELEMLALLIGEKRVALAENDAELARIKNEMAEGRARTAKDRQGLLILNEKMNVAATKRSALLETQAAQEQTREQCRRENAELNEKRHKLEMQMTKTEYENRALQERIWEDYEITYASAREYQLQTGVREAAGRIASLKTTIRLMGNVNVSAVDDCRVARERHEYLRAQQKDMQKARDDLENLIAELEKNMRKRFTEQFNLINENFKTTFTELFGGGSAQLRLADTADALESDIEIIAQPPGKKLQSLSLLSGGEKALTAIAILFAMLKLKPSPFCILDEIESTLDDVNVVRFAKYLRNYSEHTQFIIITHRKDSMAQSDILYGITMEEKGVSKMVSVRLSA